MEDTQERVNRDPAQQELFWKCVGCGKLLTKKEWWIIANHEPTCDWALMIPITGRTGD